MKDLSQNINFQSVNYSGLYHHNPRLATLVFERNGNVLEASESLARILEIEHEELLFKNTKMCFDVNGKSLHESVFSHLKDFFFKAIYLSKEGNRITCEISGHISEDGQVANCLINNISDIGQKERQLQNTLNQMQNMIDASQNFIWAIDSKMNLIASNEAFQNNIKRLWGIEMKLGASIIDERFPIEVRQAWRGILDKALSGEFIEFVDTQNFNGEVQHFMVTFNPILGVNGKTIGVSCCSTDKTELIDMLEEIKKEIVKSKSFESKLISSQLNPHFMFNALNSIQYYILEQDPESAVHFLSRFAALMRLTLKNSTKAEIELGTEIDFLELYLDLEKCRFQGKFDYEIQVDEKLKEALIPPMLIQPLIENAIIHGFSDLDKHGKIKVKFEIQNNQLIGIVEDNGIGRVASALRNNSNGKTYESMGTSLIIKRIALLNDIHDKKVELNYFDLENENGEALGTKAVLDYPLVFDV